MHKNFLIFFFLVMSSCQTTSTLTNTSTVIPQDYLLMTPSSKGAVYTQLGEDFWLERRTSKDEIELIYTTLATGDYVLAEGFARKRISKNPDDHLAFRALMASLALQKKHSLAAFYAQIAIEKNIAAAEAYNILGLQTLYQSKPEIEDLLAAEEFFNKAQESSSTHFAAALNLGQLRLQTGKTAQALDAYTTARVRCKDCESALMGIGLASLRLKRYDLAKTNFENLIKKNPRHAQGLFHLAMTYKLGYQNQDQSEKYLNRILEDNQIKDQMVKRKANTALRVMRAERKIDRKNMSVPVKSDSDFDASDDGAEPSMDVPREEL